MKLPDKKLLQDTDFQSARVAMKRARLRAIEQAKQNNGEMVVFEQGEIIYVKADCLMESAR